MEGRCRVWVNTWGFPKLWVPQIMRNELVSLLGPRTNYSGILGYYVTHFWGSAINDSKKPFIHIDKVLTKST